MHRNTLLSLAAAALLLSALACARDEATGAAADDLDDRDMGPAPDADAGALDATTDGAPPDDARAGDQGDDAPGDEDAADAADLAPPDLGPACPEPAPCALGARSCQSNIAAICEPGPDGCPRERLRDCNQEALLCSLSAPEGCAPAGDLTLEPNDRVDMASALPPSGEQRGAITSRADEDWYRVSVAAPGVLLAELRRDDSRGAIYLQVCREQPNTDCAQAPTLEANDAPARALLPVDAPGDYLLRVTAGAARPYVLRLDASPWTPTPPAARFHLASPLAAPRAWRASFDAPAQEHWYALHVAAPGRLHVEPIGPAPALRICDAAFPGDCTPLESELSGAGTLALDADAAGPRYLVASRPPNGPADYALYLDGVWAAPPCALGERDGGDGACASPGQCSPGFQEDGRGRCASACAPTAAPAPGGGCEAWRAFPATELPWASPMAAALPGGRALLLATDLSSGALYDPQEGLWRPLPAAPVALTDASACASRQGEVLIFGGQQEGAPYLGPVLRLDPATGQWSQEAPQPRGRLRPLCAELPSGEWLVALGGDAVEVDLYDGGAQSWRAGAPLGVPRAGASWLALSDGEVLVVGADSGAGQGDAARYDPATNTWTPTRALDAPHFGAALVELEGGDVLAIGGQRDGRPSALVGRLAQNRWEPAGAMRQARARPLAARLPDGRVLVAGEDARTELYDPMTAQWGAAPSLNLERRGAAILPWSGGALLVGGEPTQGGDPAHHPERFGAAP
jgi:hypothetical protein